MALPQGLDTFRVTWKTLQGVADGPDPDDLPDVLPVNGTVTFTPRVTDTTLISADGNATLFLDSVTATVGPDGILVNSQGNPWVVLVDPNSPGLTVQGWTWQVTFKVNKYTKAQFDFTGEAGATYDLAELTPVAASPGVITTRGPQGPAGVSAKLWASRGLPGERGLPEYMAGPPAFGYEWRWIDQPSRVPNAKLIPAVVNPDGPASLNTDAFAFLGGPWRQKGPSYPSMYMASQDDMAGEPGNFPYIEFMYYGSDFEFGYVAQGWLATRVWVDGKLAEDVFASTDPPDGSTQFRRVTFDAPTWRHIRIDLAPNGFYGVFAGPSDVVMAPSTDGRDKLLIIGDSFAEGTGSNGFDGYPTLLGRMLGFDEVVGASQGGTGLLATGSAGMGRTNYIGRKDAWPQVNASHVLVQMSHNDDSYTDGELAQAVRNLLPVLEALPGKPELWFVGHWANNSSANVDSAHRDSVVQPIVEAAGHLFVSQVEPTSIWSGTGHVGAPAGDGSCDVLVGPDGTHPTQAGHEGMARNLFTRLMSALNN